MIFKNTIFNLFGLGLPFLAAVFSIPVLIQHLGVEKFGLLTLIWAVVSYMGLFDLGLGRALTQQISLADAKHEPEVIPALVRACLALMVAIGSVAGLATWVLAAWGLGFIDGIEGDDAVDALRAMSIALPFVIVTSGLRGIMEARSAFDVLNLIRLPMGVFTFLGPVAVVMFWDDKLASIAWALCVGRIVACVVHLWFTRFDVFGRSDRAILDLSFLRPLMTSGGWLTVSNVVSPMMGYVDRFMIGALMSASMVAYYATPNEIITKIWIIPGALTAVLFPRFTQEMYRHPASAWALMGRSVEAIFCATLPITLLLALFAHEVIAVWIGSDFAVHSAPVLAVFALGILVNCMSHIPYTLIQGAGMARITALIHCAIILPFVTLLFFGIHFFGLLGAVLAWLIRIVADAALMFFFAWRITGKIPVSRHAAKITGHVGLVSAMFFAASVDDLALRVTVASVGVAFAGWRAYGLYHQWRTEQISPEGWAR